MSAKNRHRPTLKRQVSIADWFREGVNRQVTRGELLKVLTIFESRMRREFRKERSLLVRFWEWLKKPAMRAPKIVEETAEHPTAEERAT